MCSLNSREACRAGVERARRIGQAIREEMESQVKESLTTQSGDPGSEQQQHRLHLRAG